LQQGNNDGARIYASNAIRKKSESLSLLRLSSRLDAVSSRVETAVTMRQVTGNMTSVVKGMDKAMETMNLERVRLPFTPPHSTPLTQLNSTLDLARHGQI
jgi:charged multivesicular body protein 1